MVKVKVRITIGMAEAVRAGKSEYGKKVVEINPVELSPEEREVFLKLPWVYTAVTGSRDAENLPDLNQADGIPPGIDGSPEDIRRLLAANGIAQAKAAEAKAKAAAEAEAKLLVEVNWLLHAALEDCIVKASFQDKYEVHYRLRNLVGQSRDADDRYKLAAKLCDEKNAETKRRDDAAREAKAKAQEEAEAKAQAIALVKREFISAWVSQHGSESQKARLAAGLLPSKEIEDILRDDCFAEIDHAGHPRYCRMDHDDIDCDHDCDPDDTVFTVEDSTEATDEEFRDLVAIKKLAEAKCCLRTHTGTCRCDSSFEKKSILVTVPCGPFTFSREYAV